MRFLIICFLVFSVEVFSDSKTNSSAIEHAPIGVMADHFHKKGESMISIRYGSMKMDGNIFNGTSINTEQILTMPNPLSNMPTYLSVVPNTMDMSMTMIGGMYAPSNDITLMAMGMFMDKSMNLSSYEPMMGRGFLGEFTTSSSDLSDLAFGALFKLKESSNNRWHSELTLQKSLDKNELKDEVLTPMGMNMQMILPYGMQIGDNATRLVLGITNVRNLSDSWVIGNQFRGKFVISDKDWSFGDVIEFNSWIQYEINSSLSLSSRIKFIDQDNISGKNPMIMAPVQTANPKNYGGREIQFGLGLNLLTSIFPGHVDRVGIEFVIPIEQDKNRLQMETDYQLIAGYQKSF
jgi:hypothetical protein